VEERYDLWNTPKSGRRKVRLIDPSDGNGQPETMAESPQQIETVRTRPHRLKRVGRHFSAKEVSELLALQLFEDYWLQGVNGGIRTYRATGDKFGLSPAQVIAVAKLYRWDERIAARAHAIARRLDEQVVEKVAEVKKDFHLLIRGLIKDWFAQRLGGDEQKALTIMQMDAADIVRLVKLDLTLLGQPDTIRSIEGSIVHTMDEKMKSLSDEDLKALIASRKAKTSLPPADVTVEAKEIT
jgi:hypothetical protein